MNDVVVDSSVVAKWVLTEDDSQQAISLLQSALEGSGRLVILDLAWPESANAIWVQFRRQKITAEQATTWLNDLRTFRLPLTLPLSIWTVQCKSQSITTGRSMTHYLSLVEARRADGVTADHPLYEAVRNDYPSIKLLRNWS